ncbi:MAG: RluA family pseudouridine synthase [Fidelibacterota bacterium]
MPVLNLTADVSGVRLDRYLADEIEIVSRSKIKRVIESQGVLVNGQQVKPSYLIQGGEVILVDIPDQGPVRVGAEDIPLDIIHEDHDLIVVNKQAGLVVHPGAGNRTGTLVNALVYHFDRLSKGHGPQRPGIVHRLDKNTSGVLVVAKNDQAHLFLARQFARRTVEKMYLALVWGLLKDREGTVDEPLVRHPRKRRKFTCDHGGRPAVTRYRTEKEYGDLSLVELFPLTGRTHQLRVHMSWIGHPILGDPDYGGGRSRTKLIGRQALHARRITFLHPSTGERVLFSAPVPEDFQTVLDRLERGDE